jgi:tetratricopeptide (TPR) repeat protein
MFQDIFKDVYGLDECNLTEYFEQVQIQQSPNYAYGEEIAVISEKTKDSFSLSKSYEIFTQWLVDSNPPWESKSEESSNVNTSAAIDFESIGLELQNKGEDEKALSYYNRSLAIYEELNNKKELAQIHNNIGILLKNMKRYDDALDNHQKALDIHINIKDQLNIAKDYANIASIFEKKSEFDQALKLYDEALKINPDNIEVYYNKGKVLEKLKRFEEAIKCYDQVIRLDPKNVDVLNEKGNILYNQGKYQEAIEYFNKVLSITPYSSIAQNTKNLAQVQLDRKSTSDNRKAIVIGINKYESDPLIPRLDGAENDAKEIRDRLIQYGNFEISDKHYLIGPNATRKNILRAIGEVFRSEDEYDLVIFYFSGHGIPDETTMDGYLAPYDYYPDDPFVSGINLAELKKAISNTKNIKNTIIILDCCYGGIVTKDTKMAPQEQEKKRNLFSTNVQRMIESSNQGQGKMVLASTETTTVSREKNNCMHGENDSPHSHGAFSFYLIEGLDGKAADPDTGIINIESLRKYIEDQMTREGKQKPIFSIAEASNFDNIKIAISKSKFEAKIKKLVKEAKEIINEEIKEAESKENNFIGLLSLHAATKKVNELILLDPQNEEIPRFKELIDKSLEMYKEPTFNWLTRNMVVAKRKLNEIRDYLDDELYDLVDRLSFNELSILSESYLTSLDMILTEVSRNTKFETPDDRRLNLFIAKLRAVFENEKSHLKK